MVVVTQRALKFSLLLQILFLFNVLTHYACCYGFSLPVYSRYSCRYSVVLASMKNNNEPEILLSNITRPSVMSRAVLFGSAYRVDDYERFEQDWLPSANIPKAIRLNPSRLLKKSSFTEDFEIVDNFRFKVDHKSFNAALEKRSQELSMSQIDDENQLLNSDDSFSDNSMLIFDREFINALDSAEIDDSGPNVIYRVTMSSDGFEAMTKKNISKEQINKGRKEDHGNHFNEAEFCSDGKAMGVTIEAPSEVLNICSSSKWRLPNLFWWRDYRNTPVELGFTEPPFFSIVLTFICGIAMISAARSAEALVHLCLGHLEKRFNRALVNSYIRASFALLYFGIHLPAICAILFRVCMGLKDIVRVFSSTMQEDIRASPQSTKRRKRPL